MRLKKGLPGIRFTRTENSSSLDIEAAFEEIEKNKGTLQFCRRYMY